MAHQLPPRADPCTCTASTKCANCVAYEARQGRHRGVWQAWQRHLAALEALEAERAPVQQHLARLKVQVRRVRRAIVRTEEALLALEEGGESGKVS